MKVYWLLLGKYVTCEPLPGLELNRQTLPINCNILSKAQPGNPPLCFPPRLCRVSARSFQTASFCSDTECSVGLWVGLSSRILVRKARGEHEYQVRGVRTSHPSGQGRWPDPLWSQWDVISPLCWDCGTSILSFTLGLHVWGQKSGAAGSHPATKWRGLVERWTKQRDAESWPRKPRLQTLQLYKLISPSSWRRELELVFLLFATKIFLIDKISFYT